jgi:hypothetical protein
MLCLNDVFQCFQLVKLFKFLQLLYPDEQDVFISRYSWRHREVIGAQFVNSALQAHEEK